MEVWAESSFDVVPQNAESFRAKAVLWASEQGYSEEISSLFKSLVGNSFSIPTYLPDSFALYQERLVRRDPVTDSYTAARLWYDEENGALLLISQRQSGGEKTVEDFSFREAADPSAPWASYEAATSGEDNGVFWSARMLVSDAVSEETCREIITSIRLVENPFIL